MTLMQQWRYLIPTAVWTARSSLFLRKEAWETGKSFVHSSAFVYNERVHSIAEYLWTHVNQVNHWNSNYLMKHPRPQILSLRTTCGPGWCVWDLCTRSNNERSDCTGSDPIIPNHSFSNNDDLDALDKVKYHAKRNVGESLVVDNSSRFTLIHSTTPRYCGYLGSSSLSEVLFEGENVLSACGIVRVVVRGAEVPFPPFLTVCAAVLAEMLLLICCYRKYFENFACTLVFISTLCKSTGKVNLQKEVLPLLILIDIPLTFEDFAVSVLQKIRFQMCRFPGETYVFHPLLRVKPQENLTSAFLEFAPSPSGNTLATTSRFTFWE